ncbi:MAG: hypothetical protein GXP04_00040 [Alphaproteobacteria bacterium]|nr:hypothetical protein [Alphaproteobacteria bacterium]
MTELVKNLGEIEENILRLHEYRSGSADEKKFFHDLMLKGHNFVAIDDGNGNTLFAPSRFVGYRDNNSGHLANRKRSSGGETDARLNEVLGNCIRKGDPEYSVIENLFQEYCTTNKINPSVHRKGRKFWHVQPPGDIYDDIAALHNRDDINDTEKQALRKARLGQGRFRKDLLVKWGGCSVTGCTVIQALRASHMRPWKESSNQQRLDPYNGLLLVATLDALFDAAVISFDVDGRMLISPTLKSDQLKLLGASGRLRKKLNDRQQLYLEYHREKLFRLNE